MKAAFAFLFLVFVSFKGFSQFETPKKTINIAPVSDAKGIVAPKSSKVITYPSIFDKKDKLLESVSLLKKKPEEEKSVFDKEKFADPAREYKETFDNLNNNVFKEDYIAMNYGSYISKTQRIKIMCRDYDQVDGDQVRILLDDIQVFTCTLSSDYTIFYLDLPANINVIDFQAINEGEGPPNTAQFTILDANEELIYNNRWSLLQGFRARIKITR